MKQLSVVILLFNLFLVQTISARTVEIDVYGMTCAFCVNSLERKFGEMKSVSQVQVSLTMKKVRLETEENSPDIDTIKQTVLDAGFTPVNITVLPDEAEQN